MRRLSAIMFTDIVGYSTLTQENEAQALRLLETHRAILRPIFLEYGGREIETAGDLFFVEFNSAVEGVSCAVRIQQTLFERNQGKPTNDQIRLRIGLHIGDVVYVDQHVHGDGVNIAARIQPLSDPGGICISEDVARQVRNKVDFPVVSLGQRKLKNITMPMEVFGVLLPWEKDPSQKNIKHRKRRKVAVAVSAALLMLVATAAFLWIHEMPTSQDPFSLRLAVLPFENLGGDLQDDYFADGMTEELISSLSKIHNLHVIARTSTIQYKNVAKSISEVGNELHVGSIIAGTVRKYDNKARVAVQLIDVATQEHIWSMEYDRSMQDILSIQTEIARHVAGKLRVILASSEKHQLDKPYTADPHAFEEYLIGKHYLNARTTGSIRMAVEHLERSVALDHEFAYAYASLAYCYSLLSGAGFGTLPDGPAHQKARDAVQRALAIDETLAEAHAAQAYINFRIDWDWEKADTEFRRAIELKPGYSTAHEWYALFLSMHKRFDESLREMKVAVELDPMSLAVNNGLGRVYHYRGEMDRAVEQFRHTLTIDSTYGEAYFSLSMSYFKMRKYPEAEKEMLHALALTGRRPVMIGLLGCLYAQTNRKAEAEKLLQEVQGEKADKDLLYARALILLGLRRTDEAMAIFTDLVHEKYSMMVYMNVERDYFDKLDAAKLQPLLELMTKKTPLPP
ncbi:MAG TPA: adenylate/guanylate cyclase domain-containing protein [Chryseolinea sp.]|nr:adenylate/guanylate cyclase domain-containing protein [Chryseolinea sp.]